ncbi:MAG: 30S ribosomal protein S20 [Alphaproteobacteria bacterium]
MANHKSAKSRIVRNNKKAVINAARRSRVRTFIKKVEAEISASNKDAAKTNFAVAESEMMRAVSRGIFTLNKAARTISRLSKKIKNI